MKANVTVVLKYEDWDLDSRYIAQRAGIINKKILIGTKVNPTLSAGADKGRSG